jgi:hypothetical protein
MLKTAHKIITGLIIGLGLLHVLVTFVDYDEFSLRALWFASAGVAIILAGFLNLVLLRDAGRDKIVWLLCLFTNIVFVIMFAAALYLMQQPQVFLGVALFAVTTFIAFVIYRTK